MEAAKPTGALSTTRASASLHRMTTLTVVLKADHARSGQRNNRAECSIKGATNPQICVKLSPRKCFHATTDGKYPIHCIRK